MKYKKKIRLIFIAFFITMFFVKKTAKNYTIVITESLPLGLYKLTDIREINIGDIVQFIPEKEDMEIIYNRGYLPKYAKTLLKIVAANYNNKDEIKIIETIENKKLYVGENDYGAILLMDSKGRKIKQLDIEELKPRNEDEYLLLSSHSNSYDSRYFGPINKKSILKKAELIIKF